MVHPMKKGSRAGVILESIGEVILEQSLRFEFEMTNNKVEYETLLAHLRLAKEVGVKYINCWSDSKLVSGQLNGEYQTKDPQMTRYYHMATQLKEAFTKFELQRVVRENNERADLPLNLDSIKKKDNIERHPRNKVVARVAPVDLEWMTKIRDFLEKGSLPKNPTTTRNIKRYAIYYVIEGGDLYEKGFTATLLKCLT